MPDNSISTIIVSFNTAELTCQAISSVLENYQQDKIDGEVIVVDNNSGDNSVLQIQKQFKSKVQLIQNKKNLGFARANNQGIAKAQGDFIFLLNSDTVLKPHAIKNLLAVFEKNPDQYKTQQLASTYQIDRLGIVSGQLLNPDGSIQPQGGALPNLLNVAAWYLWPLPGDFPLLPTAEQYHIQQPEFFTQFRQMGWLGGTAMLIKKELLDEIGGLDEAIFMYAEDVEFCLRAKQHHWDIAFTPEAQIVHFGSASSSNLKAMELEISGLLYTYAKHYPIWQVQLLKAMLYAGTALRLLLFGIILQNAEKKTLYTHILKNLQKG